MGLILCKKKVSELDEFEDWSTVLVYLEHSRGTVDLNCEWL